MKGNFRLALQDKDSGLEGLSQKLLEQSHCEGW